MTGTVCVCIDLDISSPLLGPCFTICVVVGDLDYMPGCVKVLYIHDPWTQLILPSYARRLIA